MTDTATLEILAGRGRRSSTSLPPAASRRLTYLQAMRDAEQAVLKHLLRRMVLRHSRNRFKRYS